MPLLPATDHDGADDRTGTDLRRRWLGAAEDAAYAYWELPGLVGVDRYQRWVRELLDELGWYAYKEAVPGFEDSARIRTVARYFDHRDDLLAVCRARVDELFRIGADAAGKDVWCEKTPLNVLSAPFLWELFPGARLVHIVRHPERVVVSHLDQPWAPDDVDTVCSWLEPIYRRLLRLRETGQLDHPGYVEVRLEDLAADWPVQRARLFDRLGLPDAETELGFEPERHTHHWRILTPAETAVVRDRLGFVYEPLGYDGRRDILTA